MREFRFFRDFNQILWLPTLQVAALRIAASGCVWYLALICLTAPGQGPEGFSRNPILFLAQWFGLAAVGIPILGLMMNYLLGPILRTVSVPIARANHRDPFASIFSLLLVVGDPILYLVRRTIPALVPVEGFRPINRAWMMFVLGSDRVAAAS